MDWWMWVLLGFLLLVIELLTPGGFYIFFFGVSALLLGALVAMRLAGPQSFQWLLFSVFSVVTLLLFRRPLLRRMKSSTEDVPIDSFVGEAAQALDDIAVEALGKAELRGSSWTVRNVGTQPVARGQYCRVERVEGLILCIKGK